MEDLKTRSQTVSWAPEDSFTQSVSKPVLSSCQLPSSVLGSGESVLTAANKTDHSTCNDCTVTGETDTKRKNPKGQGEGCGDRVAGVGFSVVTGVI